MGQGASATQVVIVILLVLFAGLVIWDRLPVKAQFVDEIEELSIVKQEWYPPQMKMTVDQKPIKINDRIYDNGLGVHAASEIAFAVPSGYTRFVADTGVDDEIAEDSPASVQFIVLGDGVVLYEGPVLTPTMEPRRVDVNIEGVSQLTLRVLPTVDGNNSDHADWADARLLSR